MLDQTQASQTANRRIFYSKVDSIRPTYGFEDDQLTGAVDRLLADMPLRRRMATDAERYRANPGTVQAADLIEQVARTGQPIYR